MQMSYILLITFFLKRLKMNPKMSIGIVRQHHIMEAIGYCNLDSSSYFNLRGYNMIRVVASLRGSSYSYHEF